MHPGTRCPSNRSEYRAACFSPVVSGRVRQEDDLVGGRSVSASLRLRPWQRTHQCVSGESPASPDRCRARRLKPAVVLFVEFLFRGGGQIGWFRSGEPLLEVEDQSEYGNKADEYRPNDSGYVVPLHQHYAAVSSACCTSAMWR